MKSLIIVPAFNESGNISAVIENIKKKCAFADYLVVDDCSTDSTRNILEELGASYISAPVNLGIGGAVQSGYCYAFENGYDVAIQVDGDGQHDVSYIKDMIDIISNGECDIVIGSRFLEKNGFQSSKMRRTGIRFLDWLIKIASGAIVTDATSGFRAVNRNFIEYYSKEYPDDYPEPEAIVMAALNGGRVKEVPVIMHERGSGKSSINIRKSIYYMIKVTLAIIIRRLSILKKHRKVMV